MTIHLSREEGKALLSAKTKRSKYGAKRTKVDGIVFDSKRESEVYLDLKQLERAGRISGFARQRKFNMIVNGEIIGTYRADFAFIDHDQDGRFRVIDVKGVITRDFRRVQKIIKAAYNIEVEVWK
jgi:hypothetical protein